MAVEGRSLTWEREFERGLEKARAERRPVLLDFSAAPM